MVKKKQNLFVNHADMNRRNGWGDVPDAGNGTKWWKKWR